MGSRRKQFVQTHTQRAALRPGTLSATGDRRLQAGDDLYRRANARYRLLGIVQCQAFGVYGAMKVPATLARARGAFGSVV